MLFFKNLRSESMRAIPWRRLVLWASGGLVAYGLSRRTRQPYSILLELYQTAIPFKTMLGGIVIGTASGGVLYAGGLAMLFGVASYFSNRAFGNERLPWARACPQFITAMHFGLVCAERRGFWVSAADRIFHIALADGASQLAALSWLNTLTPSLPSGAAFWRRGDQQPFLDRLIGFTAAFVASTVEGSLATVLRFSCWAPCFSPAAVGETERTLRNSLLSRRFCWQ